jgi:hypothetical protein
MAGVLMRNGALRPTPNQPKRNMPLDFSEDQFSAPEPSLPKNPFKVQQQPRPAAQKPFNQQPRPAQSFQQKPVQSVQSTQLRAAEQMRDQLRKQEQAPIQDVEAKESSGMGENPPDDWLTPKIYKGSTNF